MLFRSVGLTRTPTYPGSMYGTMYGTMQGIEERAGDLSVREKEEDARGERASSSTAKRSPSRHYPSKSSIGSIEDYMYEYPRTVSTTPTVSLCDQM